MNIENPAGRTMHITWMLDDTKQAAVLICRKIKAWVPFKCLADCMADTQFHDGSYSNNKENQR